MAKTPPRGTPPARKTGATGPKSTGTNEITSSSRSWRAPPERITVLRVRGTGRHVELPAVVAYTVGREPTAGDPETPRADVLIPSGRKGMSLIHANFEWRGDRLWCRDARSTNGTYANHEAQHDWFLVNSGARLDFGDVSVIAMDWRLAELCEHLAWCIGLDAFAEVDRALHIAVKEAPLMLVGPRGSDQEWLARKLHDASVRRGQPFTSFTEKLTRDAAARLAEGGFGTVFVDLTRVGKVTASFAQQVFAGDAPHLRFRPIIAARAHVDAQRAFQQLGQGHTLVLPSLSSRASEVVRLIDALLKEHGSQRCVKHLGPEWMERLTSYDWPNNLGELREVERRIRAVLETDSVTDAAKRVGSSRQALTKFLNRIFG